MVRDYKNVQDIVVGDTKIVRKKKKLKLLKQKIPWRPLILTRISKILNNKKNVISDWLLE